MPPIDKVHRARVGQPSIPLGAEFLCGWWRGSTETPSIIHRQLLRWTDMICWRIQTTKRRGRFPRQQKRRSALPMKLSRHHPAPTPIPFPISQETDTPMLRRPCPTHTMLQAALPRVGRIFLAREGEDMVGRAVSESHSHPCRNRRPTLLGERTRYGLATGFLAQVSSFPSRAHSFRQM